jgi:hypothetical protein
MLSFGRHERSQTPQEFIQEKKSDMLDIRENVPEVLTWVMNDYLKKFDKTLTDTKSKVNKSLGSYIEPKVKIVCDDENSNSNSNSNSDSRGPCTESAGTSLRGGAEEQTGEILSDFADKSSSKMFNASEKMRVVTESDSEDDEPNSHIINC